MKLESTKVIDIEEFVPAASIDRLYWDTPYHLMPSGKTGMEAFAVIRAAMVKKGMLAIGRLVMSTRERVCAIESHGDGLVLTTLRTAEEVRSEDEVGSPEIALGLASRISRGGRALIGCGARQGLPSPVKLRMPQTRISGVRR